MNNISPPPPHAGRKPWRAPRLQDLSGPEHTSGSITNAFGEMFMKGVPDPVEVTGPLSGTAASSQMGNVS